MKFTLAATALLAAAAQASAQSLTVISTSFSGSGCGTGSTSSVTSGAVNYTPASTFAATTPPATTRNCQVHITANIPTGFRFRFAQSNVPVTLSTPSGNSAQIFSTYFFSSNASNTGVGTATLTSTGPATPAVAYTTDVWSPCGGSDIVNINTRLRASGSSAGSITIAGAINNPIVWEAC